MGVVHIIAVISSIQPIITSASVAPPAVVLTDFETDDYAVDDFT